MISQSVQDKKTFKLAAWGSKILGLYFILSTVFYALRSAYYVFVLPKSPIHTLTYSLNDLDFTIKMVYESGKNLDFSITIGTLLLGFAFYACSFVFLSMADIISQLRINLSE